MEKLRLLLDEECDYRMKDETMDAFMGLMSEVKLKNKEPLIPYGCFDDSVYIVKEGLIRSAYIDGIVEKTWGFCAPGTLFISYHSFYNRKPSFFQYESCGSSVVAKVAKSDFDALLQSSPEFLFWIHRMQSAQLYFYEMKLSVLNGTAEERLEALVKSRPEILRKVSSKVVASYIGVTPSSLCRLKKKVIAQK